MRAPRPALWPVVAAAVLLACGSEGGGPAEGAGAPTTTTTVVPITTQVVPTNGWVQVSGRTFDLVFTCYAPGAGDVAAIGVGEVEDSGERVEALVQGFLGQPYVGVTVGDSARYEAALDEPLDVYLHDDTISAGAVRWERDLDLGSGSGEEAGYGAVFVECTGYETRLPEGW